MGLLLKMQIHSLPAGGAFGAAETVVSTVTSVYIAAALMNAALSDKMKMPLKLFWQHTVPFKDTFI